MIKFSIGIDLGGTNIKVGIVDTQGHIVKRKVLATTKFKKRSHLINALSDTINQALKEKRLAKSMVSGVGMGVPGPVDSGRGVVYFFPNVPGWKNVPLRKIMQTKLKMPVFVENDVNLMALAESEYGAGKGSKNIVCITLGTGVGGGIIADGQLYRGETLTAGEIGHMPINEIGPVCNCGGRACLERYVGNRYILQEARRRLKNNKLTLEELSELAKKGNSIALDIWRTVGRRVGIALTGVVNLLNPARIVIGGGVSGAGKILFDEIRKTIKSRAMPQQAKCVKVVKAKLANDAGVIGAALLFSRKLNS